MRYTDVLSRGKRGAGRVGERISDLLPDMDSLKRSVRDMRSRLESCGAMRHGQHALGFAAESRPGRAVADGVQRLSRYAQRTSAKPAARPAPARAEAPRPDHARSGGPGLATGLILAAGTALVGAGVMFFTDPARGRRRRHLARDKAMHAWRTIEDRASKAARDAAHRAQGLVAETRARFRDEEVPSVTLVARVRSAMGRAVSNPGSIIVDAQDGCVVLSGTILEDELEPLLATVWGVRGVQDVQCRLEPHAASEGRPDLQGRRRSMMRANAGGAPWQPAARLGTGLAGGLLVGGGLVRGGVLGLGLSAVGAALAAQSATGMSTRRLTGYGGMRARRAVDVQKTIRINAPIDQVFDFFALYENFPRFMSNIKEIRDLGSDRSRWIVRGPAGIDVEWEAVVTRFEPGRAIAWRSVGDSPIPNAGTIRFDEINDGATRVDIKLSYAPPGGPLGHAAAALFGTDPKSEMDADLMRAKVALETGRTARDAAEQQPQPVGHEAFEETRAVRMHRPEGAPDVSASGND